MPGGFPPHDLWCLPVGSRCLGRTSRTSGTEATLVAWQQCFGWLVTSRLKDGRERKGWKGSDLKELSTCWLASIWRGAQDLFCDMAKDCCNVCGLSLILPNLQHQWSIFVDTTHRHTDSFFILEDTSCPDSGPDLSVENSGIGSEKFLEQLTMSECFPTKGSVLAFFFDILFLLFFPVSCFPTEANDEASTRWQAMEAPCKLQAMVLPSKPHRQRGTSLDGLCSAW